MFVKYVGTGDYRTLLAKDLPDTTKEDITFFKGVPTEITKKVWEEAIKDNPGYAGEFEETEEQPPAEQGQLPFEVDTSNAVVDEHDEISLVVPLTNAPDQVTPPQGDPNQQIDDDASGDESTDSGKNSKSGKSN